MPNLANASMMPMQFVSKTDIDVAVLRVRAKLAETKGVLLGVLGDLRSIRGQVDEQTKMPEELRKTIVGLADDVDVNQLDAVIEQVQALAGAL